MLLDHESFAPWGSCRNFILPKLTAKAPEYRPKTPKRELTFQPPFFGGKLAVSPREWSSFQGYEIDGIPRAFAWIVFAWRFWRNWTLPLWLAPLLVTVMISMLQGEPRKKTKDSSIVDIVWRFRVWGWAIKSHSSRYKISVIYSPCIFSLLEKMLAYSSSHSSMVQWKMDPWKMSDKVSKNLTYHLKIDHPKRKIPLPTIKLSGLKCLFQGIYIYHILVLHYPWLWLVSSGVYPFTHPSLVHQACLKAWQKSGSIVRWGCNCERWAKCWAFIGNPRSSESDLRFF